MTVQRSEKELNDCMREGKMNQKCRRAQKESPSLIGGGEAIRPGIGQSEGSSFQGLSPPWLIDGSIKMFIFAP